MESATLRLLRKFLIVTPNVLVAEDLRETLSELGETGVDVRASLAQTWQGGYTAAFLDAPVESLVADPRIRDMHRAGTCMVLLDRRIPEGAGAAVGLHVLPYPFRSSDVVALLTRLGIVSAED